LKGNLFAILKLGELYTNILQDVKKGLEYYESISDKSAIASINVALLNYPDNVPKVIEYYENTIKLDPNFNFSKINLPPLEDLKGSLKIKSTKSLNQSQSIKKQPQLKKSNKSKLKNSSSIKKSKTENSNSLFSTFTKIALGLGVALSVGYVLHKVVPRET